MLAFHGHHVEREFYVNDAGSQIRKFGESIRAVADGHSPPEDGYKGDYVVEPRRALKDTSDARRGRARARRP